MGRWGSPGRFELESPDSAEWLTEVAHRTLVFTNHVIRAPRGEIRLQTWQLRESAAEARLRTVEYSASDHREASAIADRIEAEHRHQTDRLEWTGING